jgi:hypothetical protein
MKIPIWLAALMMVKGSLAAVDDLSVMKTQTVRYRAAI